VRIRSRAARRLGEVLGEVGAAPDCSPPVSMIDEAALAEFLEQRPAGPRDAF
jgi:hypothetical protein